MSNVQKTQEKKHLTLRQKTAGNKNAQEVFSPTTSSLSPSFYLPAADFPSYSSMNSDNSFGAPAKVEQKGLAHSKNHFNNVFKNTPGPSSILLNFLNSKDLVNLAKTSKQNKQTVSNQKKWQESLRQDVGPDPNVLINPGESAYAAYNRHRNILQDLASDPLPSLRIVDIAKRTRKYSQYYWDKTITDAVFAAVIPDIYALREFLQRYPAPTDRTLKRVLTNHADFIRVISHEAVLYEFTNCYPAAYATKALETVFVNELIFTRMAYSVETLCIFTQHYPLYRDKTIETILTNEAIFDIVITDLDTFRHFVQQYPDYKDKAIQRVLTNDCAFTSVIGNLRGLYNFARLYPDHIKIAIERLLTHEAAWRCVITNIEKLEGFLRVYRTYTHDTLKRLLTNEAAFASVVNDLSDFYHLLRLYSAYAKKIIDNVLTNESAFIRVIKDICDFSDFLEQYPNCTDTALNQLITSTVAFPHLVNSIHALRWLIETCPTYADKVIERILTNSNEFFHIIKDESHLQLFLDTLEQHSLSSDYAMRTEKIFMDRYDTIQADKKSSSSQTLKWSATASNHPHSPHSNTQPASRTSTLAGRTSVTPISFFASSAQVTTHPASLPFKRDIAESIAVSSRR